MPYAYKIIKMLNDELKAQGFMTISGRVNREYFNQRFFGSNRKHKALSDKVTLSADDYEKVADLARKQIAAEKDTSGLVEAVDKLTSQNDVLSQQAAKLREQNNRLDAERSTLPKTVDGLRNTLRSVQEELSFWNIRFSRVMEFLELHSLGKKWEEWEKAKKNKTR